MCPVLDPKKISKNFKKKAELFNSFIASQCSLIKNDSKLPSHLNYKTDYRLLTVNFSIDDIAKILQNLDPNKAHGHGKISIRMLQLCGNSIGKPLELIFKQSMESGSFPSEWKKGNVVPIHKKDDKQCLSNYRPVSLLPICGKFFERLIFNEMFKFFIENELISPNQSGFKPGDSYTNQLLAITHEIYKSFDEGFEVRGVFLDISTVFDKVWYGGLIFKSKQNGISANLINLFCDFLRNRKQRILLNGQVSGWSDVKAGVPQGSILGPLLFLISINDSSEGFSSNAKLFTDGTSLFSVIHDSNTSALELNKDLAKIDRWAFQRKMSFNPDPKEQAQEVIFSRKSKATSHPPLVFNNNNVMQAASHKHLGIILDIRLSFEKHLETVLCKINKTIDLIHKLQNLLPRSALITLYKAFVRPHLDYGDILYDQARTESFHLKLESIQYNDAVGIGNYVVSTRSLKTKVRVIYSI